MARKPLPTQLKLVKGTLRKDRTNKFEPVISAALAGVPEHLTETQKAIWTETLKTAPAGLLKQIDSTILEVYVVALDAYRDAAAKVTQYGSVSRTPNNFPVVSPFMSILNKQSAILVKACSEMGFTPASRTRVEVKPEDIEGDPWAALAEGIK